MLRYDEEDENSLSPGKINRIFEDIEGDLWIAVYNNGIDRYNPITGEIAKYNEDNIIKYLPNNQINDFIEVNGVLFASTNGGLIYYDKDIDNFKLYPGIPKDMLVYAIEYVNNEELWIGTYNHGLIIYNLNSKTYINYQSNDMENPIADNLIYDILADSKGRIWIATNNGLNLKDSTQEKFKLCTKETGNYNKIANNTIRSIFEDSDGKIWIAVVGGGLAYFVEENDSFISFTEDDGLPSNVVVSTVEDSTGNMWCSTENGIAILKPETHEIFSLTPNDGIGSWEFSSDIIRTRNGSIMLGGVSGITSIPEDLIMNKSRIPKVYIDDVLLFNESINENQQFFNDENLEFDAFETSIEFSFVALDYDSRNTHFLYKLIGFDEDWVRSGTRNYVSYSNLPAGNYKFVVIAKTAKDEVSELVSVSFSIKKMWYRTNIAYFSFFILMIIILRSILKLREGQLMKVKNFELARLNDKLENANVELEKISTKDPLTNLYNRRYFEMMFKNHLNMAIRGGTKLALVMVDIDDFKNINDKFGHIAGDGVLKDIAIQMNKIVNRSTDFITRFGGNEFIIVLYDTDCENTDLVIKKLIELIRLVQIREQFADEKYTITASIGVGCIKPRKSDTIQNYIELADQALYESKNSDKNRITIKTRNE